MSVFEPDVIRGLCARAVGNTVSEQRKIEADWNASVEVRVKGWESKRKNQSCFSRQLEFEAHLCEYTTFLSKHTRATTKGAPPTTLSARIPLLGPYFEPPSFSHIQRRSAAPEIVPDMAYLKPVTLVHPVFFPELAECPQCGSTDVTWYGWSPTGHREVHGITREETAIGYQLRCTPCKKLYGKGGTKADSDDDDGYSFLTTNCVFWEKREHWELPVGMPIFLKKSALTSDLFNLLIELRPSSTAGGLAEHIRQLHLLEYHKLHASYLQAYERRSRQTTLNKFKAGLQVFARPATTGLHHGGYDCRSISDDLIGVVYNRFVEKTRKGESEESLRTKSAITIALDATFRAASKATIVDTDKKHTKVWTGGLLSILNERGVIIAWRWCPSQSNNEYVELLEGVNRRLLLLGNASPELAVVDNCCHVKAALLQVFPDIAVVLDVWHFVQRYLACVLHGSKNPHRLEVGQDISNAILKSKASNGNPARYWSKEEQEERLVRAYEKWVEHGDVWSAAAEKVHADQLAHVKKGCLARPRDDVASDGSRIEGSHKGWNGIQRSFASGIESQTALGHDHVLRRNIRVEYTADSPSAFVASTYGCHHVRLVNYIAYTWNDLLIAKQQTGGLPAGIVRLPILEPAPSGETFGLMKMSAATASHYTFVKQEPQDDLLDLSSHVDPTSVLDELGIDPKLAHLLPSHARSSKEVSATPSDIAPSTISSKSLSPIKSRLPGPVVSTPSLLSSSPIVSPKGKERANAPVDLTTPRNSSGHPAADVIDISDDSDEFPDAATLLRLTSTTPRKRRADSRERMTADDGNTRLVQATDQDVLLADLSSVSLDPPPAKKPRLFVAGNAKGKAVAVDDKKPADGPSSSSFFAPARGSVIVAGHGNYHAPCLPIIRITGLTPSQQIFSLATGLDPRSIAFARSEDEAFFLFMELRKEHQWATFKMSSRDYVVATTVYNRAVEQKNAAKGRALVRKTPRALLDKLHDVETTIIQRVSKGDYKSQKGTTKFWYEHCHAVPLRLVKPAQCTMDPAGMELKNIGLTRRTPVCKRCKAIMYPGGEGCPQNHKRGVCSDGARTTAQTITRTINGQSVQTQEEPPQWPQPAGIFKDGKKFNGRRFLAALEEMYERVVKKGDVDSERTMEYLALVSLLQSRIEFPPATDPRAGKALFRLFDGLELEDCPAELIVKHEGSQFLHINYLCHDPAIASGSGAGGSSSAF